LKIVLGTKNVDKLKELQSLLKGSKIQVLSLRDFPKCPDVKESGRTFEANARKKARFYAAHTGLLTLADDSGLMVDHLNGKPGVYSARFAGPGCGYQDNNRKVLKLLKNVPPAKRKAKFVCVIALYYGRKCIGIARGECRGRIALRERGKNGFGYDPVFIPNGFSNTYAELSPKTKNLISHRGRALRKSRLIVFRFF
jgi:XTP/dITP diphosphohydrolase